MDKYIDIALGIAEKEGASEADIRIVDFKRESINCKNESVEDIDFSESMGFGVRVLLNGAWGFASSSTFDKKEIERVAKLACDIARASAKAKKEDVVLDNTEPAVDEYITPFDIDPFEVPVDEKIEILMHALKLMRKEKSVQIAQGFFTGFKTDKIFASLSGARIHQIIVECGGGISATAIDDNDMQTRSYPNSFRGNFASGGFEFFAGLKISDHGEKIASEAGKLLTAKPCPEMVTDLIIDGNQLGLQIHESCGHPIELDRVFGMEAAYAGTSFLTTEKLDKLKYGSDIVNITADATIPGGLGTFGYDDEGVPAQCTDVVKDGQFVGYLMSRETAPKIGLNSNGAMRADGWDRIPIVRMTNVSLLPGTWKLDDLIEDTEDGLFITTNKSWSIDDKRVNFQFGCEVAWKIENGKLTEMYKNPTYTAKTVDFWNSCDAICDEDHWIMWGTPNCGKGEPSQIAHTGHGASPTRFRNIQIIGTS
jgi:TldD protein